MADLLTLPGDNGSWKNRLAVAYSGANSVYNLTYNGAAVAPNIAATELTVSTRDVEAYNPANTHSAVSKKIAMIGSFLRGVANHAAPSTLTTLYFSGDG